MRLYRVERGAGAALPFGQGRALAIRAVLFTDGRYIAQANAEAVGTQVVIATRPPLTEACEWIAAAAVRRCGFDRTQTTIAALATMRKAVPAKLRRSLFVAVEPLVAKLRQVKDVEEIASLRAAAALGCRLFDRILTFIQPGMTEMAVAAELEHAARLAGAEGMSFETIVAGGQRLPCPMATLPLQNFPAADSSPWTSASSSMATAPT